MHILSILFAVLCAVFVSAGIAHHSQHAGPNVGPTPICPARTCAVAR
jgi:hypothetical protein